MGCLMRAAVMGEDGECYCLYLSVCRSVSAVQYLRRVDAAGRSYKPTQHCAGLDLTW